MAGCMAAAAWLVENVTGGSSGTASREHGSGCMASREHGCGVAWLTGWVDPSCTSSRSAFFGDRRACVLAARTHIGQRTWGGVGVGHAESARETGGALWSLGTMSELGAPELHGGDGRIAYPILALYAPSACSAARQNKSSALTPEIHSQTSTRLKGYDLVNPYINDT